MTTTWNVTAETPYSLEQKNRWTTEALITTAERNVKRIAYEPEFMRLPPPGEQDAVFGLTRSFLNNLILPNKLNNSRPKVKSYVLRQRGAKTGVRLISVLSLREYILSNAEG